MLRLALLSFWHVHAKDYERDANEHPGTEIVAAWDEQPERGRREAEKRGWRFYEQLDELLANPEIDGVIVTTPTSLHREVMVAAAQAGKHIFTEKVLAATLHDAQAIVDAAEQAGIVLTVSLPRLAHGYTQAFNEMIAAGLLGDLTQVRVRIAHGQAVRTAELPEGRLPLHFYDPAEAQGGALIDLGAHPLYLVRLLAGMPDHVQALYGFVTGRAVEDNAVVLFRYASGAIGIAETGFVSPASPPMIEAHGTAGSMLYSAADGKLRLRSTAADNGMEWITLDVPADQPGPFAQWVAHIERGTKATDNITLALDHAALVEAANKAAESGQAVAVNR
jgi:1,5-anhydro-D-fructose reductase (1,5-anhydro-D-mannitol-forming)